MAQQRDPLYGIVKLRVYNCEQLTYKDATRRRSRVIRAADQHEGTSSMPAICYSIYCTLAKSNHEYPTFARTFGFTRTAVQK